MILNRLSLNRRDLNRPLHDHRTWRRSSCRNRDHRRSISWERFRLLGLWQETSSLREEFGDRCFDPVDPNRLKNRGKTEQEKKVAALLLASSSSGKKSVWKWMKISVVISRSVASVGKIESLRQLLVLFRLELMNEMIGRNDGAWGTLSFSL